MGQHWSWVNWVETGGTFFVVPHHLRFVSSEEQTVAESPGADLLGIKNLLEKGQFRKSQFTDIVLESRPPDPDEPMRQVVSDGPQSVAQLFQNAERPAEMHVKPVRTSEDGKVELQTPTIEAIFEQSSTYGPKRRKYSFKQPQDVCSWKMSPKC